MQQQKIAPCLWFDGRAEEAVAFYTAVFPRSKVVNLMRYGDAGPGPKGAVLAIDFQIEGHDLMVLNGGPQFTFSPAISLFVRCETQEEVDGYWRKLAEGGSTQRCGWLTDKFGVSWQIVPTVLGDMLRDKDAAKAQRVMEAMLQMDKLDIRRLNQAYEG